MSLKKIHELTGFSYSTISRVINGKAEEFRVSKKTRAAILEAAKQLDYRPSIIARSLRLKRTMTLGLIVPDIQNPTFAEMASKIERLARQHGYSTILCNSSEIPENEKYYLQVLIDRQVDGIIISPMYTEEWEDLKKIKTKTPVVLISRIFTQTDLPWVTSDNHLAASSMTRELIRLGYKRIAFLGGTDQTYINSVRFQGFQEALTQYSLNIDMGRVFFKGYTADSGEYMMKKLLMDCPDVEAVFCVNNMVFFGAMKVVQKYESEQGRSIMMAAFDINRYFNFFRRPLLSADQDFGKMASSAVNLLIDRIEDIPLQQNHLRIPVTLSEFKLP